MTPLLDVQGLSVSFHTDSGKLTAVDDISFSIQPGTTAALVGESGCGKSVTALSLARLLPHPPASIDGGRILFDGVDLLQMEESRLEKIRGAQLSYVFQEPSASLNPVLTIGRQIGEALLLHRPELDREKEVLRLLDLVRIPDARSRLKVYPHELSGGQQQRVMIAMALACQPKLLVADEPTTALDVTIQAQILKLLADLQKEFQMSVLLITHNLGLVADIAHDLHVMYAGKIVESGPAETVLSTPHHPYTQGLLNAVPRLEKVEGRLEGIPGTVPAIGRWPEGCRFHPRCSKVQEKCRAEVPRAETTGNKGMVRCHYWK
jgi:oligopeptide/dipeptide ABC transporter ATP-binding protein